jgi:methionyl-tRNA formyltransferase
MRMVPALDAGPILLTSSIPVLDDETYGELQLRLSELGALTLVEAMALMSVGEGEETPQDDSLATYAPKVTRNDARVSWNLDAEEVCRIVRAYDPKPGAFSSLSGLEVKLFGARRVEAGAGVAVVPGTIVDTSGDIVVACRDGHVRIRDVQPAGRARMRSAEWARGRGVAMGDVLE